MNELQAEKVETLEEYNRVREFKKWMSLVLLSQMGNDKPNELMINSLIRAKFYELTAEGIGQKGRKPDFFLMGLFSLIVAFLDRPMTEALQELPILTDIKTALQDPHNQGAMSQVLRLTCSYEQSDWDTVSQLAKTLKISGPAVLTHYLASSQWAKIVRSKIARGSYFMLSLDLNSLLMENSEKSASHWPVNIK